jgi:hypothetical protein
LLAVAGLEGAGMQRRPWTRMTQLTTLAIGLGMAVAVAWGGEKGGTVKSVDQSQNRVVLENGTQLWLMRGLSLDLFAQGKRVKVVYDESEDKKWVRSVEATN